MTMPTKKQVKLYSFAEMIPLLIEGRHFCDTRWPSGWECFIRDGILRIVDEERKMHDWIISLADLESTEYEVLSA